MVAIRSLDSAALAQQFDREKNWLWASLGILISLLIISGLGLLFNHLLGNPITRVRMMARNERKIASLRKAKETLDIKLATAEFEIHSKTSLTNELQSKITAQSNTAAEQLAAKDAELAELQGTRHAELQELQPFREEANRLRPRVGEQEDRIRSLCRELDQRGAEIAAEKTRSAELAKKLGWVRGQMARHLHTSSSSSLASDARRDVVDDDSSIQIIKIVMD
jgi:chromosome segregation ATPase